MEITPMYTVYKHSIVFTPDALDTMLVYTNHVRNELRTKLEEYHTERAKEHGDRLRPIVAEDALTASARQEIARAEQVAHDIQLLRDEMGRIYTWHFAQLAEVFRLTRAHLQAERIEDFYTLQVALHYLMRMLKEENPKFNPQYFVDYINGEQGGINAATA
ncbi:MAG TPA: hypothetical protein PKA05_07465 [Roseiflexaceae bacterium]|nr:hypothetical protein [Roseiflexaceae bacterium]HMP40201.1 hypothetical protein [Roseiflexaceae bacterium]